MSKRKATNGESRRSKNNIQPGLEPESVSAMNEVPFSNPNTILFQEILQTDSAEWAADSSATTVTPQSSTFVNQDERDYERRLARHNRWRWVTGASDAIAPCCGGRAGCTSTKCNGTASMRVEQQRKLAQDRQEKEATARLEAERAIRAEWNLAETQRLAAEATAAHQKAEWEAREAQRIAQLEADAAKARAEEEAYRLQLEFDRIERENLELSMSRRPWLLFRDIEFGSSEKMVVLYRDAIEAHYALSGFKPGDPRTENQYHQDASIALKMITALINHGLSA